jgi:hypothetical protein
MGRGKLAVEVVRDGRLSVLQVRSRDLRLLEETSGQTTADKLKAQLAVPAGMILNTETHTGTGSTLAWPTMPRNRDLPREQIPAATQLWLVIPANHQASH